jgi:AraC-like DNA-binding protein
MKEYLKFENIKPYVRYAKILTLASNYAVRGSKAYDHRLLYFFSGEAEVTVDGVKRRATRGSFFLWNSGLEYSIVAQNSSGFSAMYVNFDYTYGSKNNTLAIPTVNADRYDITGRLEDIEFIDVIEFNRPVYLPDMRSLELDFHNLENEFVSPQKNYSAMLSALLFIILIKGARRLISDGSGSNSSFLVNRVIEYIHKNYADSITNESIGTHFSYHPNYINRSMIYSTGQSLHQYVISVRILKALEYIQTTDNSMGEIAKLVGFKSIKHFSQSFKKIYGFPPTHFKKRT